MNLFPASDHVSPRLSLRDKTAGQLFKLIDIAMDKENKRKMGRYYWLKQVIVVIDRGGMMG